MTTRLIRALPVAAALTAVSIGAAVPGPALAGDEPLSRWVLRDGPGDVLMFANPYANWVRVNRPTVDITRTVVRHGPRAVTVRMRFVDLRRVKRPQKHVYTIAFTLPRDGRRPSRLWLDLKATPKHQGGRVAGFETEDYYPVRCPRLTYNIDYAGDAVTIHVPRRCLGTPAWVRVHIENYLFRPVKPDDFVAFHDSAHPRDYNFASDSRPAAWALPKTPRLYRPDR